MKYFVSADRRSQEDTSMEWRTDKIGIVFISKGKPRTKMIWIVQEDGGWEE